MTVGAVVIGRNEAAKLPRCLSSILSAAAPIVFVDSGSGDASVDLARQLGVDVLELDESTPFTVARARNAGFARAVQRAAEMEYVQFVDADSELFPSWLAHAEGALRDDSRLAAVFGRVRERCPGRSVYSRLYEAEFEAQFAAPDVCGGMAMMRVAAVRQIGGFNAGLLGFEDFDLSFRLRRAGWHVKRLDADMALHEAGMNRLAQWWSRQVRGGYARAQQVALHGRSAERTAIREYRSTWAWGLLLPLIAIAPAAQTRAPCLLVLCAYAAFFLRIALRARHRGTTISSAVLYSASCVLGKVPQALGQLRFQGRRVAESLRRERQREWQ
jgi:cellulose synthase/poly-beta-1,6-N-acetylglucosamine synthase-like glycosyltransferase